jgi:hypothetical protein
MAHDKDTLGVKMRTGYPVMIVVVVIVVNEQADLSDEILSEWIELLAFIF